MNKQVGKIVKIFVWMLIGGMWGLVSWLIDYQCPWKRSLGLDCAGCGVMRMIGALINFEWYQAFRYNPLFFLLMLMGIIYGFYVIISLLKKKNYYQFDTRHLWGFLFVVIIFMILRNTEMFSYLKPTVIN